MGLTGIIGGTLKVLEGIVTLDGDKVVEGTMKTIDSTGSTIGSAIVSVVNPGAIPTIIHNPDDHAIDDDWTK